MEPGERRELLEALERLREENRVLRDALDATASGRLVLRQGDEFSRLLAVSRLAVSELDVPRVCELLATQARELVDADLVLVPMLDAGRERYTYVAAAGAEAGDVVGTSFLANVGMCGWVLQNERSLLFGEPSEQPQGAWNRWEQGQQSAVLVPLFGRKRIIGGLSALGKRGGGCFTRHDLDLLTMFANQVSVAIENAQLFEQARRDAEQLGRMARALRDSEERLNTILDNVGACIFLKDRQYRYVYVNQATCDVLGRRREELLGKDDAAVFPPESVAEVLRSDRPVLERGETTRREEHPIVGADGEPRTYWTVKLPVRDADGLVIGLCGISTDITAPKRAEAELREKEQFIRRILDSVDEGFIVVDRDLRIVIANKAFGAQVGVPVDQAVGRPCYALSHKRDVPCDEAGEPCAVRKVFADGEPHAEAHVHCDAAGNRRHVETRAYPMKDAQGRVVSAIETVIDTTQTRLLEQERLKTQKLESIGTLAGGLAHDFNNLLQGVFGQLSMAKLFLEDRDRALAMLEQAEQALKTSIGLTNQLLTFAKGGAPVKKCVALPPVVTSAARFALSGSRCGCSLEIAPDLWSVDADAGQLGQVVQNIVLNASQAMPDGGAVVVVARNVVLSGHSPLPDGRYVEISVEDTGIGIPEKHLPKIFDPYFTTKEKGSGLGLATSYSIVRSHGGAIDVVSMPGKGTTFRVYLPATDAPAASKPAAPARAPGRKGRILVMDDEKLVLRLAGQMLKALGHEVELTERGEDAIESCQRAVSDGRRFDAAILDLTIRGGMGGREAVSELRKIDPGIVAIVSSGYSDDASVAEFRTSGFDGCLTKPYRLEDLRETLDEALKRLA